MSRSGYSEDCENLALYREAVRRAIQGKRGRAFLQEMLTALDALPEKRLISHELRDADGEVCAIGSVGLKRGVDMSKLDVEDADQLATAFGIAPSLVREIEFMNDDDFSYRTGPTPEQRFASMRAWVVKMLETGDPDAC